MPYEEMQRMPAKAHTLSLENRSKLSITGVEDVAGFDESVVVLKTTAGVLTVKGQQLHVEQIDLDNGRVELRGSVQDLGYDESVKSDSLWTRLFG